MARNTNPGDSTDPRAVPPTREEALKKINAGVPVTAPDPAPALPQSPIADDLAAQLKALGADLVAAADDEVQRSAKLDHVLAQFKALSSEDRAALLAKPAYKALVDVALDAPRAFSPDTPPGTVAPNGFKKMWTWGDVVKGFKLIHVEAGFPVAMRLTWNGLTVSVPAMEPVDLYEPFFAIAQDHFRNVKIAHNHAAWLMGKTNDLIDPTVVTMGGAMVRAISNAPHLNTFEAGAGVPSFSAGGAPAAEAAETGATAVPGAA